MIYKRTADARNDVTQAVFIFVSFCIQNGGKNLKLANENSKMALVKAVEDVWTSTKGKKKPVCTIKKYELLKIRAFKIFS